MEGRHEESEARAIDGLTPDQRFFVGYGQSWCGQSRDETKRLRATVDPHSPEKYRTNGVVSNMPEFQQAFHCKAGSADGERKSLPSLVAINSSESGFEVAPPFFRAVCERGWGF